MMSLIPLHAPVGSSRRLERVHMFAGRHLGEEEFDREQDYADARLAPTLRHHNPGIVHGLEINVGPNGLTEPGFIVNPGLALAGNGQALGLYYPLRVEWSALITEAQRQSGLSSATGVYYLLLTRSSRQIDSPRTDPCSRAEFDPTRDTRRVVTSGISLQRLNIAPDAVSSEPQERIENWIAADRVDGAFMRTLDNAVPLALVAIGEVAGQPQLRWLSQEAGRYEALPQSGYRVLLNQCSAALRRIMQRAALEVTNANPLPQFLSNHLFLDFLPAAGELPLQWLRNAASSAPSLLWLPTHLGIDMVAVPEEAVLTLIHEHLPRRVIDLRRPAGDKIRLLLAVNEPDYRPNLLDIPQTDAVLEGDIFRFHRRAHEAWRRWLEQFNRLYFIEPSNEPPLSDPARIELERRVLDPAQFKNLDLPKPELAPPLPATLFTALITRANAERQDPQNPATPYPYNKGAPAAPADYSAWLVGGNPPGVANPSEDGLVVQYAIALVELEAIESQLRALRSRVEKTRDFLLLQRQQLDSQTVALAALAGGVAGDGNGLQVARWLPYANLDASTPPDTTTPQSSPVDKMSAPMMMAKPPAMMLAQQAAPRFNASSLSASLTSNAFATSSSAFKANARLGNKPQTYSAFELGINKSRLEMLAQISREAVAKPAFEAKEYRFGVIDHISPEINEYAKAYYGMKELLATLTDLFDATDASTLKRQLEKIGQVEEGTVETGNPFERSGKLEAPDVLDNLASKNAGTNAKLRNLLLTQYRYHGLFKAGRILTQWIAVFEARYNTLERKLQGKLREQSNKLAHIDKLAGLVRVARETLDSLDRFRIEQLGDYGVAQRLLDEDWRKVYADNLTRTRILTSGLRGLYYVRVRATPITTALADPLALHHGSQGDLVPGVEVITDIDLPDPLDPFFDAVCEVPMDDWSALHTLRSKLPPVQHFDYLSQLRSARFASRASKKPAMVQNEALEKRLQTVHNQTQVVLQHWALTALPLFGQSLVQTQVQAARVLSLADLSGAGGPLRKEAQLLRDKLETALAALLTELEKLPPSLRLQWGQLAEDDELRVEDVSWWPGLERAERDDFNATRTVSELIAWWFRQLKTDASANSRSALRNMIRAALIHASLGDPQEIVRGLVHVPPRLSAVGERLQVKLNRAPKPGTRLQLLDVAQRVVAVLAVEDHGPHSTEVSIVSLVEPQTRINTRFSVVANKETRRL